MMEKPNGTSCDPRTSARAILSSIIHRSAIEHGSLTGVTVSGNITGLQAGLRLEVRASRGSRT